MEEDHPRTLIGASNVALVLQWKGKFEDAKKTALQNPGGPNYCPRLGLHLGIKESGLKGDWKIGFYKAPRHKPFLSTFIKMAKLLVVRLAIFAVELGTPISAFPFLD